jgi:hypothetical protein
MLVFAVLQGVESTAFARKDGAVDEDAPHRSFESTSSSIGSKACVRSDTGVDCTDAYAKPYEHLCPSRDRELCTLVGTQMSDKEGVPIAGYAPELSKRRHR